MTKEINKKLDKILSILEADKINENVGINYEEVSEYGGIRLEEVEQERTDLLLSGDPNKIRVAQDTPEWYVFLDPDRTYTPELRTQIQANQTRSWVLGSEENIYQMYHAKPLYIHKKTGAEKYSNLSGFEYMMGGWERVQNRFVTPIKNHAIVSNGNFSNPHHEKWQTELRDKIPEWVINKMRKDIGNFEGSEK